MTQLDDPIAGARNSASTSLNLRWVRLWFRSMGTIDA